jgi:hypothetical protein
MDPSDTTEIQRTCRLRRVAVITLAVVKLIMV